MASQGSAWASNMPGAGKSNGVHQYSLFDIGPYARLQCYSLHVIEFIFTSIEYRWKLSKLIESQWVLLYGIEQNLMPLPPVHFLGSTPTFLRERSSLTADSSKALNATKNTSMRTTIYIGFSMAGVQPEDKEVLGGSLVEEPTMVGFQSKASKRQFC